MGVHVSYILAVKIYFARRGAYYPRERFQRCAFACAVAAEQRYYLALPDFEAYAVQRRYFPVISL